jgi:hypothetical protein
LNKGRLMGRANLKGGKTGLCGSAKPYLSFDLDGTLVDLAFTDLVWHRGIPELFARRAGMDLPQAQ